MGEVSEAIRLETLAALRVTEQARQDRLASAVEAAAAEKAGQIELIVRAFEAGATKSEVREALGGISRAGFGKRYQTVLLARLGDSFLSKH
jgi:hypothetical protein